MNDGIILKGVGGNYHVFCEGREVICKAGGRLRLGKLIPLAGDRVTIEIGSDGGGYITAIGPRVNSLARPAVANIDCLFILATEAPPKTDTFLIDKVAALALWQGIRPAIVLAKSDLNPSESLCETYREAGFEVFPVSAVTCQGIDALRAAMSGKASAFTGNSGVGKSSLLNRLDGRFALNVGEMSAKIERGKNTTRHVELLRLDCGGFVADTPGFSSFDVTKADYIPKERLSALFPEIGRFDGMCRFSDCRHISEPGCEFLAHLAAVPCLKTRHESYVKLYSELSKINAWEV